MNRIHFISLFLGVSVADALSAMRYANWVLRNPPLDDSSVNDSLFNLGIIVRDALNS
jgi:hypothetical protein